MNRIKTIFTLLFMTVGFAAFSQNIITTTDAQISITGQTTREELSQISRDLKAQGIVFKYWPTFNSNRQLTGLSFEVNANDGALTGTGAHTTLSNPSAILRIHINKTANTCDVEKVGEPAHE